MTKTQTLLLAAVFATISQPILAREGGFNKRMEQHHFKHGDIVGERANKRQSFSETSTRTLANGETIRRDTVQKVTENGFTRHHTFTNSKGQTATKNISVVNDKIHGRHTHSMTGTTFDGRNFNKTSTTQKTDNGYIRQESFVTPEGKTGGKEVRGIVNKAEGTITKNITVNTPTGEVKQHSVTHKLRQHQDGF